MLVGGCLDGASSAPPSTTPAATPSAAPPSVARFDPSAVSIILEPIAVVPGSPLAFAAPGDGSGRLFVAAKAGQVRILRDGVLDADPLLDVAGLVSAGYEQGLLGIAVHPDFPADPRIVLDYTNVDGDTVVASYRLDPADPDRLDPASAVTILAVDQPFPNHNGGAVAFGPDGYLYVALGDGGDAGDPFDSGERLDTLFGKILRLDLDTPDAAGAPYAIPADNPFVDAAGARAEIWLTGLRNPWRMGFDRQTGDLWIGDVGQNAWEEIDVARAGIGGLDFGWDRMEGAHCFEPETGCATAGLTLPMAEYGHELGCTVIGGAVYRGAAQPLLAGGYLFADHCSGRLWAIPAAAVRAVEPTRVGTVGPGLAGFGEDEAGELFAANLDGTISRVVATAR
jgi:glucose/arabinose dehydrogenase